MIIRSLVLAEDDSKAALRPLSAATSYLIDTILQYRPCQHILRKERHHL